MSTPRYDAQPSLPGKMSILFGVLALAAFGWIWALSSTSFDPVEWMRIVVSTLLPIGLVGAAVAGVRAWPGGERVWAAVGIGLAGLGLLGLVVLANIYE